MSTPKMPFHEAKNVRLTFGKKFAHIPVKDRTLDRIAETDVGLNYLEWLRGKLAVSRQDWQQHLFEALEVYLSDPTIARELTRVGTTFAQNENARNNGW